MNNKIISIIIAIVIIIILVIVCYTVWTKDNFNNIYSSQSGVRYIKIYGRLVDEKTYYPLNIAGVFVYDENGNNIIPNLSAESSATMSTTDYSSKASNALKLSKGQTYGGRTLSLALNNEGNPEPKELEWSSGNVIHSSETDQKPSWKLDLGSTYNISAVEIFPRTDCCCQRNQGLAVELLNDNQTLNFVDGLNAECADNDFEKNINTKATGRPMLARFNGNPVSTPQTNEIPNTTSATIKNPNIIPETNEMSSTIPAINKNFIRAPTVNKMPDTNQIPYTPTFNQYPSSTQINNNIIGIACKYLSISLNKINIAGIIVVDKDGKNMFYGNKYEKIVSIPSKLTFRNFDNDFNEISRTYSKELKYMFSQTSLIAYDENKSLEEKMKLLDGINYTDPEQIFSYKDENLQQEFIFDLNPGIDENVIVSKVILLLSKNKCGDNLCMYSTVGNILLLSKEFKNLLNWTQTRDNPTPPDPKHNSIEWKIDNTSNKAEPDYILNFTVGHTNSTSTNNSEKFKNIISKSRFNNLASEILPINANEDLLIENSNIRNNRNRNSNAIEYGFISDYNILNSLENEPEYIFPISPDQTIGLLNSGVNLDTLSSKGIAMNSAHRGPSTNIVQTNFTGTSNIYSPYLYYNKGVNEQFSGLTTDTNQNYSLF